MRTMPRHAWIAVTWVAACLEQDPNFSGPVAASGTGSGTSGGSTMTATSTGTSGTSSTAGSGGGTATGSTTGGSASSTGGACRPPDGPGAAEAQLAYDYYEGNWNVLPDFAGLTAAGSGLVPDISLSVAVNDTRYAVVYRGYLQVHTSGLHAFHVASDDGSRLWLGSDLVVDNDGEHGVEEVSGERCLTAGLHTLEVQFFQGVGEAVLTVELTPPGGVRGPVAPEDLFH